MIADGWVDVSRQRVHEDGREKAMTRRAPATGSLSLLYSL